MMGFFNRRLLSRGQSVALLGLVMLLLFAGCTAQAVTPVTAVPEKETIQIRVKDDETLLNLSQAEVTLIISGQIFPVEQTDSRGVAVFEVNKNMLQETARIEVEKDGYFLQRLSTTLINAGLVEVYLVPDEVTAVQTEPPLAEEPEPQTTSEVEPEEHPPTDIPAAVPAPIHCDNPKIVDGIFDAFAQSSTTSFAGAANAALFCDGVYDLFHTDPPAIKIEYTATADSFAYFGLSNAGGVDMLRFSQLCFWSYTDESDQDFDIKLESPSGAGSVRIQTTLISQWEEHCPNLAEFGGVDLKNVTAVTLSFNDSFGSVFIWVDDFELR